MKSPQLDEIDRLGGNVVHQGGPYDALSPNRNRNRARANSDAPVAAFDPNGPNVDPNITNPQEEKDYHMQPHLEIAHELTDDAPVKGPSSAGLGSTTYMDDAPASREAIREQEQQRNLSPHGETFLGRVRSLSRREHGGEESEGLLGRVRSIGRGNRSRSNTATSNRSRSNTVGSTNSNYAESYQDSGIAKGQSTTTQTSAETLHHRTAK